MAITKIHKITSNVDRVLDYCTSDKIEENTKDDIADIINYATNDKTGETTYFTINSSQNCVGDVKESFHENIERCRGSLYEGKSKTKDGSEVLAWHLVQSFDGIVDPHLANEIGLKLAQEMFPDFPVSISTHTNTENTHNHIVICAWDLNGKKWNNCNENYRKIRETSDRLCDEYGLNVLEKTREQKLIRYKDKDGATRYFEPTTRKIDLVKQRDEGLISNDDVNSYRNTMAYEDVVMKELSNREIIKKDIDDLLNVANSYDHLIQMLRDIGYEIKDKKKNGEWREHISFKNPTASKATRDKTLSEDGFYNRENLTSYIEEMVEKRKLKEVVVENKINTNDNVPYFEDYTIEHTNPDEINEDYRKVRDENGTFHVVNRTLPEKDVIRELKATQKEAGIYDTYTITRLLEAQREARKKKRKFIPADRQQALIMRIQDGYNNLKFIEQKNVQSFEQIKQVVASLYGQQQQCLQTIDKLDTLVEHLESVLKTPQKLEETIERIQQKSNDPIYLEFEYETDRNLVRKYERIMNKYKIDSPEGLETLNTKINSAKIQVHKLGKALEINRDEIERYDRCIRVLERAELIRERERVLEKENVHDKTRDRNRDDKEYQREKKKDERER